MSLAGRTFRGVAWGVSTSLGGRAITLAGTLLLTRYLAPEAYGEVMVAATLVFTVNQFANLGVGQYLVANPSAGREAAFHATAWYLAAGLVTAAGMLALGDRFDALLAMPGMSRFISGLLVAVLIDRVGFIPERILIREMRFLRAGAIRTLGEVSYSALSVTLAALGWGAGAVVIGNVVRSSIRSLGFIASVDRREWLSPCRPSRRVTREMFAFAFPLWLGSAVSFAARRWDNLFVAMLFGPASAGYYNLAYSLAETPATYVAEQVTDVLLPSFAQMKPESRAGALVRSASLLALVVFPMAIGLGTVAPTLFRALFDSRWQAAGPMLAVLCSLSIARPIEWVVASYLQAHDHPWSILLLQTFMLGFLLLSIATLGRIGPLWFCAAVGISYAVHAAAMLLTIHRLDRISPRRILAGFYGPLSACVAMVGAILAVRVAIRSIECSALAALALEISTGAATYACACLLVAPEVTRDLVRLVSRVTPWRASASLE